MNWPEVERIYLEASGLAPAERAAFLDQACLGDESLRGEVEGLLKADVEHGSCLKAPPARLAAQVLERTCQTGTLIGSYRVMGLLGEGGMGTVYQAEQQKPRRMVALKVIKAGIAGEEILRRFQQEAEALGRLQHAGIAQIYDAGTAERGFGQQPYFAMELIEGRAILRYAEEEKLDIRAKLELMAKVCDAVHHAHQRGILHRDLKPGNILVDQTGQPKILDFGVARVIDSDVQATRQTDLGQLIGTLAYMSPEQASGDARDIDIRSDVYALGVILYEMLAGQLPYETKGLALHDAVLTIKRQDPTALSRIDGRYRGDVQVIVETALEKGKEQRYGSAAELASDIRRHLTDQPISARPASATYQLRKFSRRNRALVLGTAAVLLALVGGVIVSSYQAVRAREAERQAKTGQELARGARRIAEEERDRAVAAERETEREKERALAAEKRADQEKNSEQTEKVRANSAAASAQAVTDFLQRDVLLQASPDSQGGPNTAQDPDLKVRTALDRAASHISGKFSKEPEIEVAIRSTIADTYGDLGLYREALPHLERALEIDRRILGLEHPRTLQMQQQLARLLRRAGILVEAEALLKKTLESERRILGRDHPDSLLTGYALAGTYIDSGRYREGIALGEEILASQRRVLGPEADFTLRNFLNVSLAYLQMHDFAKAEPRFRRLLEICSRRFGPEKGITVLSMSNLAETYLDLGKTEEAAKLYRECLDIDQRTRGRDHPATLIALYHVAFTTDILGHHSEAESSFREILDRQRDVLGPEHENTLETAIGLGLSLFRQGKFAESESVFERSGEAYRRIMGAESAYTTDAAVRLAKADLAQGKFAAAESEAREVMQTDRKVRPEDAEGFLAESVLGASLLGQKRFAEAEPRLLAGFRGMEDRKSRIAVYELDQLDHARDWIVQLYAEWGKPEEAKAWVALAAK